MAITTIPEALKALRAGKPVLVADDEARENEGDAIMAAEFASAEWIAWMVRHTSGYLCAPTTNAIADELNLPLMVPENQDSYRTAYTVSVDAASGVTTGISAADRARTLRVLANPNSTPSDLIRPGHILPLRAVSGGVRQRPGHTEATVDLLRLAGLYPVGVIGEMIADDGDMMRLPELIHMGEKEGLPVITIKQLIEWLDENPNAFAEADAGVKMRADHPDAGFETAREFASKSVEFEVETLIPTAHGPLHFRGYRDLITGHSQLAVVSGHPTDGALVRVHSECLTGEAFHSEKCECGPQLDAALDLISKEGGVVIYLRGHEGRGIGLLNKLRAYRLQEDGMDTLQANLELDLPSDARQYDAAAGILHDLGIHSVRLLTNNPQKVLQLEEQGIRVEERLPLVVGVQDVNKKYLAAKRDHMGHLLPSEIN